MFGIVKKKRLAPEKWLKNRLPLVSNCKLLLYQSDSSCWHNCPDQSPRPLPYSMPFSPVHCLLGWDMGGPAVHNQGIFHGPRYDTPHVRFEGQDPNLSLTTGNFDPTPTHGHSAT